MELEFNIKDLVWNLYFFDPYDPPENSDLNENVCGKTQYVDNSIWLNNTMKDPQLYRTIVHELVHAFRWTYGCVSDFEISNIPTCELEEIIANTIETHGKDIFKLADFIFDTIVSQRDTEENI